MGKEREWLKDVLLNSSESSEEESTPEGKDRRIKTILKQRRLELKYVKRYRMKKTVRYVDLFVMFCTKIIFLCILALPISFAIWRRTHRSVFGAVLFQCEREFINIYYGVDLNGA